MNKRSFIAGMLVAFILLGLCGSAYASIGKQTMEVDYTDIKIELNGNLLEPMDANGNSVEPFAYEGTTYLPVRAVSTALGLSVDWDGETNTVRLSENEQSFQSVAKRVMWNLEACRYLGNSIRLEALMRASNKGTTYESVVQLQNQASNLKEYAEYLNNWKNTLLRDNDVDLLTEKYPEYETIFDCIGKLNELAGITESLTYQLAVYEVNENEANFNMVRDLVNQTNPLLVSIGEAVNSYFTD